MNGIGRSKYGNMLNLIQRWCLRGDRIVDVGCADGYLLHELEVAGYNQLIGVEPSEQSTVGLLNGLDILRDYFSPYMFKDSSVDCFVLMHVFEHFDDPFSMLDIMKRKLTADGHIILEMPYFSGEHHQHLYYYNLTFLKRLCADKGLNINLIEIDRDTETLRVVLGKTGYNSHVESFEKPVDILDKCLRMNMNYLLKIERINELIRRKKQIVWWGAGSTSVIFLNQIERNSYFPSMMTIVDGDKNKWEKYIPVINQKVYPYTILSNQIVDNMIVASSFSNEIKQTLVKNNISVNDMEVFV